MIIVEKVLNSTKEYCNALFMYVYLGHYRRKLNKDFNFMVDEAFKHSEVLSD